jgi:hypothetical protein
MAFQNKSSNELPDFYPATELITKNYSVFFELCKQERYMEAIGALKGEGLSTYKFIMYVLQKMNLTDIAIEVRDFILEKYDGYFGLEISPIVHKLFIEYMVEDKLSRKLTDDEKITIEKFLYEITKFKPGFSEIFAKPYNWNIINACDEGKFSCFENYSSNFEKTVIESTKKIKLRETSSIKTQQNPLSLSKILKKINEHENGKNNPKFLSFKEARKLVHSLKLENKSQWMNYCISSSKSGKLPNDPQNIFSKEWIDWDDWLGVTQQEYLSFVEAKKIIVKLNLQTKQEWIKFCKSKKQENIPSKPNLVYNDQWIDWDDWLGVTQQEYLSFVEAKKIIAKLNLILYKEWASYCKLGTKPKTIPNKPNIIYKNEWIDWDDWLGVNDEKCLSYQDAKKFLSDMGIESGVEWKEFRDSDDRPKNIPRDPRKYYTRLNPKFEFDWHDWYGLYDRKYLLYPEARKIILQQNFQNMDEYKKWINSNKRPKNIPKEPQAYYKKYRDGTGGAFLWDRYLGFKEDPYND